MVSEVGSAVLRSSKRLQTQHTEMELERLQDRLSEILVQLRFEQLREVCSQAKISIEKVTKKHTLIRTISEAVDSVIEIEDGDVAHEFLVRLITYAEEIKGRSDQVQGEGEQASQDAAALASLQQRYAALQLSFQTLTKRLEEEMVRLTNRTTTQVPNPLTTPSALSAIQPPEVTIRREFKINGQIGERGQKDKLSYTNLIHQIEMGLKRNHSEAEIIEAVVRAISPGLNL